MSPLKNRNNKQKSSSHLQLKTSLFTARITRKARKAFLPHRDLNASINIAPCLNDRYGMGER
jgi:predicted membrane-bound mannosyltransferase